jgi:hypothetical protein
LIHGWRRAWLAVIIVAGACGTAHGQGKAEPLPTALAASYIPPDASFALVVRPAELAASHVMKPLADVFDEMLKPANLGISVADIEEFKLVMAGVLDLTERQGGRISVAKSANLYVAVRARKAVAWKTLLDATRWTQQDVNGQKLYVQGSAALWFPDERTMVTGARAIVERTLEDPDPNDRESWTDRWEQAARNPLAAFVRASELEEVVAFVPGLQAAERQPEALATLIADAEYGLLQGSVTNGSLDVSATVLARSSEGAVNVAPALSLVLREFAKAVGSESGLDGEIGRKLGEQLAALVGSTQFVTEGQTVTIKALVTPKMLEVFSAALRQMADPQP